MARRKKYNPLKEAKSITATTVGVGLGAGVIGKVGGMSTHTPSSVYKATGMMGTIPVVQTGGSIIKSLETLGTTKKRRRK